jgi:tRNA (uracil-5-)-methyltransferase TRM9
MKQTQNLIQLNQDFYQKISQDFDKTRQYFWQGWNELIPYFYSHFKTKIDLKQEIKILDLACGNGRFLEFLEQKTNLKFDYTGIDSNPDLLKIAKEKIKDPFKATFLKENLFSQNTKEEDRLQLQQNTVLNQENKFDLIVCFGLIHHLPKDLVSAFFENITNLLAKDGLLVFSIWDFLNFESVKKKIVSDPEILKQIFIKYKIEKGFLDEFDYFLDWKKGSFAVRYCRYFKDEIILEILKKQNLELMAKFRADGKEKGVNRYYLVGKKLE